MELKKFTHGSLFSGIGGFDLAAQWMGWENLFHCEYNPFGQKILQYYWPGATSYHDIKKSDFKKFRGAVDILTGGFPCQPYSVAGKRKGKDDERHLWPEMLRAIREVQPRWIVGENVRGLINWNGGMVFDEVQADLEAEGYEVQPFLLPACAVNAPHRRDRIWFVAYSGGQSINLPTQQRRQKQKNANAKGSNEGRIITDTNNKGSQGSSNSGNPSRIWQESDEQLTGFFRTKWEDFPTEPPVRSGNDGVPAKLDGITISKWCEESLMAGGNAIVPQVAFEIFKAVELYEIHTHQLNRSIK